MSTQITSAIDFQELVNKSKAKMAELEGKTQVKVHLGTCGISAGAQEVLAAFDTEVAVLGRTDIAVLKAGCIGLCGREPVVTVVAPGKEKVIYAEVTPETVARIVKEHLVGNKVVADFALNLNDLYFRLQEVRIMANQDLDPTDIEQYIARGGYQALHKALTKMKPKDIIAELEKSGLRGRGGAGFPTCRKWSMVSASQSDEKYVVCNGDEGDPGAYMNRAVLEGNPHAIIEGMAISAIAIGNVRKGCAYIRAEYPLAIENLQRAIDQAKECGLLGDNILGSGFSFDIDIFPGAGAFVCGEETALLTSIEGKRGNPHQRPPFPANVGGGVFGQPTTLNNVETWANIPLIIRNGAEWFSSVGNETSKGTKVLCLVGNVKNNGLIEVPLGISLGTLIFDIGGGTTSGKAFKGVQIGGPSGGVISREHLNTPIDYESIGKLGAIMGSGGVVVLDEDTCMVEFARFFLGFTKDESCGKCIACREGTSRMYDILTRITSGEGSLKDIDLLQELGEIIKGTSLCGLGQTAPNPVLSTLKYFRDEYIEHVAQKECRASVCQALFRAPCQNACPAGLDVPGYVALIKSGEFEKAYHLIMQKVPLPLSVGRVCPHFPHFCEGKCQRSQIDEAVSIRHLKRFVGDYAYENNLSYTPEIIKVRDRKVAIIGSGPGGLAAAWDLALAGYEVTIFEAQPVAGGMLALGIPEYRLPKAALAWEIDNIKKLGVEIKLGEKVDDYAALLDQGYSAVLLAVGAQRGNKMNIPGEELAGVIDAVDFLRGVNLNQITGKGEKPSVAGKDVVVVGGGNSAIDAARVALREGAAKVTIVYRRERKDMPADTEEIKDAEKEGIVISVLTNPVAIEGSGKVSSVRCARMNLVDFDKDGRKRPQPTGEEITIKTDYVITAVGQQVDSSGFDLALTSQGTVSTDQDLRTGKKGVFACGDAANMAGTVIEAVASGQRAAMSVRRYLEGEFESSIDSIGYEKITYTNVVPTEEETKEKARIKIESNPVEKCKNSYLEVMCPYSASQAVEEASRCLRCDLSVE